MPPEQAQAPTATTTLGSGICRYRFSMMSMFRSLTLPVISRMSACLGLPVLTTPNRSTS
jgi:hypothetical protein